MNEFEETLFHKLILGQSDEICYLFNLKDFTELTAIHRCIQYFSNSLYIYLNYLKMNSLKHFLTKQGTFSNGLRSLYKSTVSGNNIAARFPVRTPFNINNKNVLKSKFISRNASSDLTKKIQNLIPRTASSLSASREMHDAMSPKKKTHRKKRSAEHEKLSADGYFSVNAFATAEEYDLEKLLIALKAQDLYEPKKFFSSEDNNESDVLYATAKYQVGSEPRGIYFFREGTVVMWNCSDMESSNILAFLKNFEEVRIEESLGRSCEIED